MTMRIPVILLLSAPSGAGKTTLASNLTAAAPSLKRVITCTTRAPRAGEMDGRDYHFLQEADFSARVQRGEFLEHAMVYGRGYGTLRASVLDILDRGDDVFLVIDVQGAASVREAAASDPRLARALVTVFLTPPSLAELEGRLRGRGTDADAVAQRRLESARAEAARWSEFDYLIVSGTRAEDLERLRAIYTAETLRSHRNQLTFG